MILIIVPIYHKPVAIYRENLCNRVQRIAGVIIPQRFITIPIERKTIPIDGTMVAVS